MCSSPVATSTATTAITQPEAQASCSAVCRCSTWQGRASPASSRARSARAASSTALPPMAVLRLASAPTPGGHSAVSPCSTSTWSAAQPSTSAAICAKLVSRPWPCAVAPVARR